MYRLLVATVWILIFSLTILGIGVSLAAVLHFVNPSSISVPETWHTTASIAAMLLGIAALLRAAWPKLVFTIDDFVESANCDGGHISSSGKRCSVSFGVVEVLYYFQRSFVGFDVLWMGPKYSPKRKWIQKWINEGNNWIEARHLWSLIIGRAPVVIKLAVQHIPDMGWDALVDSLREASGGCEVELWEKKSESGNEFVHLLRTAHDVTAQPNEEVLILVYVPPWEAEAIQRVIRTASELGQ